MTQHELISKVVTPSNQISVNYKPPIEVYQRQGRSSINTYGSYYIGNYPTMPYFNLNPMIGIPRMYNTDFLRNAGNTVWISMCKKVICVEVSNVEWSIVEKEGYEGKVDEERKKRIVEFFTYPNSNGETLNELLYKWCDDYLTIGDGLFIKIFHDNVKVSKSFEMNYDKYSFRKKELLDKTLFLLKSKSEIKKFTTYVPEKKIKSDRSNGSGLCELWVPDASTFLVNADDEGKIPVDKYPAYWQYSSLNPRQAPKPYFRREVIWIRNNPRTDTVYGWSPILDILPQVECLQGGTRFNQKIFENMSRPDAIVSLDGADDETCKKATQFWIDKFANQPHKILFVGKQHTFTPLNLKNNEMEWLEGQQFYQKLVMAVYHVTSDELGFSETSNRLTGPHQSRVFIRKAINPILNKLKECFDNQVITEFYNPGEEIDLEIKFRFNDEVEKQIQLDNDLRLIQINAMTVNELRTKMGLEPLPWGDDERKPTNPFSSINPGTKVEEISNEEVKKSINLFVKDLDLKKKFEILNDDGLLNFFKKYFGLIKETVLKLFDKVAGNIRSFIIGLQEIMNFSINYDKLYGLAEKDYNRGVELLEKELDVNVVMPEFKPNLKSYVSSLLDGFTLEDGTKWHGIRGANNELVKKIRSSVQDGVSLGESIDKIKVRVSDLIDTTDSRAELIARTETERIVMAGQFDAAIHSGIPNLKKQWVAIHDNKTGDDSLRLDGQIQPIDKPFIDSKTGQEFMLPPHRPNDRCRIRYFKE